MRPSHLVAACALAYASLGCVATTLPPSRARVAVVVLVRQVVDRDSEASVVFALGAWCLLCVRPVGIGRTRGSSSCLPLELSLEGSAPF